MGVVGRRKALLVGVNYRGTYSELRGCINDVVNQKSVLKDMYGFAEEDIWMIHEDMPRDKWPNKATILQGFNWLYKDAKAGDLLFFQYSGHGSQFRGEDGAMHDCICPLEAISERWPDGVILDSEIHKYLYNPLNPGVKTVALFDCCHSGTVANLTIKRAINLTGKFKPRARYLKPPAEVAPLEPAAVAGIRRGVVSGSFDDHQLWVFSGCQDNQTSADSYEEGQFQGAFTWSYLKALKNDVWNCTYVDLLDQIRHNLRGYTQKPALTTTHESYLNFWHLGSEPQPASKDALELDSQPGAKKALLIGINYRRTPNELRGCINDVNTNKKLLTAKFGFQEGDILTLTEDESKENWPYKARIVEGMKWLIKGAKKGDVLYLAYSGHGSQMTDKTGYEPTGMSDCICPLDCHKPWPEHIILDTEIHQHLYDELPDGVKLICIFDCCHSGTVANLPCKRDLQIRGFEEVAAQGRHFTVPEHYKGTRYLDPPTDVAKPKDTGLLSQASVTCAMGSPSSEKKTSGFRTAVSDRNLYKNKHLWVYSGCQDNQTSADAYEGGMYQGAFTWSLVKALRHHRHSVKYGGLLNASRQILSGRYSQVPALSTTKSDNFDRHFLGRRHRDFLPDEGTCSGIHS